MPVEEESTESAITKVVPLTYGDPLSSVPLKVTISRATALLAQAGVASARTDAELLAAHLLGISRGQLLIAPALTTAQNQEYQHLVACRAQRIPLQHLTGTAPFRRLELAVGPGVFIPRPETELLVDLGLRELAPRSVVVDLCSGSGAIALAVAQERPDCRVYAVERDPRALDWLDRNLAAAAPQSAQVTLVRADVTDPATLADLDGRVDLVLCNPPYVPTGVNVDPEVLGHDPRVAVFAGPDGLEVIPGVIASAARLLRTGGKLGLEHDQSHAPQVVDLLAGTGFFQQVVEHRDLTGRPRFVTAVRRDNPGTGLADWRA
jgi:release factor glutamine methyltransferase